MIAPGQREADVSLDVASHAAEGTTALVGPELPEGWTALPSDVALRFTAAEEVQRVAFHVTGPPDERSVKSTSRGSTPLVGVPENSATGAGSDTVM